MDWELRPHHVNNLRNRIFYVAADIQLKIDRSQRDDVSAIVGPLADWLTAEVALDDWNRPRRDLKYATLLGMDGAIAKSLCNAVKEVIYIFQFTDFEPRHILY